jgi:hypothetical protein
MLLGMGPILLNNVFGVREIVFGFPAVFGVGAVLPSDQVVGLPFLDLVFQDPFDLVFFFSVDKVWDGWRERGSVGFSFSKGSNEGGVEDVTSGKLILDLGGFTTTFDAQGCQRVPEGFQPCPALRFRVHKRNFTSGALWLTGGASEILLGYLLGTLWCIQRAFKLN